MATKPSDVHGWLASGSGAGIVEPDNTTKTNGFFNGYAYPAELFNWWLELTSQWSQYLNDLLPDGEVEIGEDLVGSAANGLKARVKFILGLFGTTPRVAIYQGNLFGSSPGWTLYSTTGDNLGYALEWAFNATYSSADSLWHRTAGSTHSTIMRVGYDGTVKVYRHPSGGSATWSDAYTAGNWETLVYSADTTGLTATAIGAVAGLSAATLVITGAASIGGALSVDDITSSNLTTSAAMEVTTNLVVGGDVTVGDSITATGGIQSTAGAVHGAALVSDGNLTVDGNSTLGNSTADTVTISGTVSANKGLQTTDYVFVSNGYSTGTATLDHAPSLGSAAGQRIYFGGAIRLRGFYAWVDSATAGGDNPIRFTLKAVNAVTTIETTLKTIDIDGGDYAELVTGHEINVSYSDAPSYIYVTASLVGGGSLAGARDLGCRAQIQDD